MIFAKFLDDVSLEEIVEVVTDEFQEVQSGRPSSIQGDAWVWVLDEGMKVSIDTFTSLKFEIKADEKSYLLANRVLVVINPKFNLKIFSNPKFEGHE